MDPTVQVAAIGIIATLISTIGLIGVAVLNNKKERGGAAEAGVTETMEQRLLLKDEQIELRDEQLMDCQQTIERQKRELQAKDQIIERLMNK